MHTRKARYYMYKRFLSSKIHEARITHLNPDYDGSLGICINLMTLAGLNPFEEILVANIDKGTRFTTYVIRGGVGEITLNGAACNMMPKAERGDRLIIMAFASCEHATESTAYVYRNNRIQPKTTYVWNQAEPRIVVCDNNNNNVLI